MVYETRTELELRHISCSSDAPREVNRVNTEYDRLMTPCVFKPSSGICSLYTIIPHGFKAVMTEYGKFIGVWKSGFHWTAPWVQVDFLVPQQQIVFNSPVKECPTQDNVMVQIDVTLLLQIKQDDQSIHDFVYNLGPARLTTMIQAFQDEAIRGMARKRTYNEIYNLMDTSMDAQLEVTKKGMNERLAQYGVVVDSITIIEVHIPPQMQKSMEQATTYQSLNRYESKKQEYELLVITNREFQSKKQEKSNQDLREEKTVGDKTFATAQQEIDQVNAQTRKIVAQISESEASQVRQIKADGELKVAQLNAQKNIELSQIQSDGRAQADKIKAQAEVYSRVKRAEVERKIKENEAKARAFSAEAESYAANQLKSKRLMEQKMRQLSVLKAIAENKNLVLSGNNGDNAVAQLLAAKSSASVIGLNLA